MGILIKLLVIIIIVGALLYLFERPLVYSILHDTVSYINNQTNQTYQNDINHEKTNQALFVSKEASAINSSSPVPVKNVLVFGKGNSPSQMISYNENAFFSLRAPVISVLYNGVYTPISTQIISYYYKSSSTSLGDYLPNLIGTKVYLDETYPNLNKSVAVPYIIQSETINDSQVYWNLTFDGNTSNAINPYLNVSTRKLAGAYFNGVIFLNGTVLIAPNNPDIS
jgi:hypothetical protein